MPTIKPLNKLVTKARTIRDHHRARHTPSGFAFAPNVDHKPLWPAVAEAIYRLRRVDKLFGDTTFVMVKDVQSVIGHAIALDCKRLSLGRTALEPKARLGARPDPMRIWIRHRIPMLNLIVRGLLHTIDDHEEPPERNPFKT